MGEFLLAPISQYIFMRGFRPTDAPASPVALLLRARLLLARAHAPSPELPSSRVNLASPAATRTSCPGWHTTRPTHARTRACLPGLSWVCWPGCLGGSAHSALFGSAFSTLFSLLFSPSCCPSFLPSYSAAAAILLLLCCTGYHALHCTTLRSGPTLIRRIGKPASRSVRSWRSRPLLLLGIL